MTDLPPLTDDLSLRERVKVELRKRMRGLRATMPVSACGVRSAKIVEALLAHEALRTATAVALFWPIVEKREVDLRPLDEALRRRGVRVAYPRVSSETGDMSFRLVDDVKTMQPGAFGLLEPDPSAAVVPLEELSAIIVPALAVDERGHRIGYGRGFYDRILAGYKGASIAVAYHYQLVSELPNTPLDVPVSWVVTDETAIRVASPVA